MGLSFIVFLFSNYYVKRIHKRERQLTITTNSLKQKSNELQLSNTTKDRFFSIIAHDLRNPISALQNLVSVFYDHHSKMTPKQVEDSTAVLLRSVTHNVTLLDNLLE